MKQKCFRLPCLPYFFLLLSILFFLPSPMLHASPSYEDFLTFTEKDDTGLHINITSSTHVDFNSYGNEDAWLYKDYGSGHFISFAHNIDFKMISGDNFAWNIFYVLSNSVDDLYGLAGETYLACFGLITGTGSFRIYIREHYNTLNYQQFYTISANTPYYLIIRKDETDFSLEIFSDSERTNLLIKRSLTLHGNWNFQYLFVCNTYNDGSSVSSSCEIENFACLHTIQFYFNEGGIITVNNGTISNGTEKEYINGATIELSSIPQNSSYVFLNFTWSNGNSTINPFNYTVSSDMIIWCYFYKPLNFTVGLLFGGIICFMVVMVIALAYSKR